jgi:ABC-type transporter Mla MlaB component
MLRITTEAEPKKVTLKLEGELTGIWVSELFDAWRAALPTLGFRVLSIDLSAVGRVDKAGEYLLALMRCTTGTLLTGCGIVSRDLVSSIARDWPVADSHAVKEA